MISGATPLKNNQPVTQNEVAFPPNVYLVSKTDLKGQITDCNDAFVQISGFTREELLGKSHNIVRHPDIVAHGAGGAALAGAGEKSL